MKSSALIIISLLFTVLLLPSYTFAKNKYSSKNQSIQCVTVPKDASGRNALDCQNPNAKCSGKGVAGHRMKLTQTGLTQKTNVYILGCIGTDGGEMICTTGNQKADDDIYGDWVDKNNTLTLQRPSENLAKLTGPKIGFKFNGLYKNGETLMDPPSPFLPEGRNLTKSGEWYEWEDYTPKELPRKWLTYQWIAPVSTAPVGKGGGNQQGTFDFMVKTTLRDCASIAWDPYGRLFDASTLEPVGNTQITLQINKGGVFSAMTPADLLGGNLINPQQVYEDGAFSFIVPDGDYKLLPTLPYVTDLAKIDPNYKKAYSEIYAGEVIQQRGAIQHRDIAIQTQNTNTNPQMIGFFYSTDPNGKADFEGRLSHPLTKINVKTAKVSTLHPTSKVPYRTIQTFQADKQGAFKFSVDQNKFEKTGSYTEIIAGIELVKVNLRTSEESSASSRTVALEPIPQYLEGYAYNSVGTVLPNATVGVYLSSGVSPSVEVITDENGLFKINTESLPGVLYNLRYTTKTGVTFVVKPSTFLAQNQQYYIQNRINPYTGNYKSGALAPTGGPDESKKSQGKEPGTSFQSSGKRENQKGENNQIQNNQMSSQIYILIIILVLLLGGVVGVVVYLKKKRTQSPEFM